MTVAILLLLNAKPRSKVAFEVGEVGVLRLVVDATVERKGVKPLV